MQLWSQQSRAELIKPTGGVVDACGVDTNLLGPTIPHAPHTPKEQRQNLSPLTTKAHQVSPGSRTVQSPSTFAAGKHLTSGGGARACRNAC